MKYSHTLSKKNRLLSRIGYYPPIYNKSFSQHISAKELKFKLPQKIFDNYFKFAFVRNPWDWQVSLYHFALQTPSHPQHELTKKFKTFDEYIEWRTNSDLKLQSEFIYENDGLLVDFVGRVEHLEHDIKKIFRNLNIAFKGIPKKNETIRLSYRDYYTSHSRKLVAEAFKKDIELFGYRFDETTKLNSNN